MASVFLRNADGVVMEQPAEVAGHFIARDWELVPDPAIAEAKAAAEAAAAIAALAAEQTAVDASTADVPADSEQEQADGDDAATTTGLTKPVARKTR